MRLSSALGLASSLLLLGPVPARAQQRVSGTKDTAQADVSNSERIVLHESDACLRMAKVDSMLEPVVDSLFRASIAAGRIKRDTITRTGNYTKITDKFTSPADSQAITAASRALLLPYRPILDSVFGGRKELQCAHRSADGWTVTNTYDVEGYGRFGE